LLYGPPGCGKTSVIEALAGETKLPLYKLKISKCGSKYINESSTNIQKAYEYVCDSAKASGAPVFFVLDEMEALTPKRKGDGESSEDGKMVGTLLQIIEEARGKNVVIIGATNLYDSIDDAIKSRFDDKKYIGLPDDDTRRQVLQIHLNKRTKGQALASNPEELDKVVKLTKGFSNRDIAILTDKAALLARRDSRREICAEDFNTPVNENQNMKVKEFLYQDKQTKPTVGFSR
jgi:ribosome biogenesis ATPase